jgi:hypothetical protein
MFLGTKVNKKSFVAQVRKFQMLLLLMMMMMTTEYFQEEDGVIGDGRMFQWASLVDNDRIFPCGMCFCGQLQNVSKSNVV